MEIGEYTPIINMKSIETEATVFKLHLYSWFQRTLETVLVLYIFRTDVGHTTLHSFQIYCVGTVLPPVTEAPPKPPP